MKAEEVNIDEIFTQWAKTVQQPSHDPNCSETDCTLADLLMDRNKITLTIKKFF